MFKHLSCQCPFKRKFEVNANTIFLVFFSLEPVHLELPIHLCPLSLKFPYFQVFLVFVQVWISWHMDLVGLYRRLLLHPRLDVGLLSFPRLYGLRRRTLRYTFTGYFAFPVGFSVATTILLFDIFTVKFYCLKYKSQTALYPLCSTFISKTPIG